MGWQGRIIKKPSFVIGCALLFYVCQLFRLATGTRYELANAIPDDAYYYIVIAYKYAHTGIVSFDGINPTNGFHPLWFWVCTILAKCTSSEEQLIRICLVISGLFAGCLPFILTRSRTMDLSATAKAYGIAIILSMESIRFLGFQTLEVGLYLFCLAMLYLCIENAWLKEGRLDNRERIVLGSWFALAALARLDCTILVAILFTITCIWHRRIVLKPSSIVTVIAILAVGLSLWFLFCKLTVGYISQDSSNVKRLWVEIDKNQYGILRVNSLISGLKTTLGFGLFNCLRSVGVILAIIVALFVSNFQQIWHQIRNNRLLILPAILLISAASQGVISRYLSADQQKWYMAPAVLAWILIGLSLAGIVQRSAKWRRLSSTKLYSLIFCGIVMQFGISIKATPNYWGQAYYIDAVQMAEASIPANSVIGSWNSGIFSMYSKHRVVNLDGLVNHEIQQYYQAHRYEQCFHDLGIDYVFDWEVADKTHSVMVGKPRAEFFANGPLPLSRVAAYPYGGLEFVLYRVQKDSQMFGLREQQEVQGHIDRLVRRN